MMNLTKRNRRALCALLCLILTGTATTSASDWTAFRGSRGLGIADADNLPVEWDSQTKFIWKQTLPGPGSSTPVVLGDNVYLTSYSGYALSADNPGDTESLVRHFLCLSRSTGKIEWEKTFPAKMPESEYKPGNNSRHGYASSTVTTDGERLYVFFGISGAYCLDLKGDVVWTKNLGDGTHGWGSGTSPVLFEELVIINASVENQSLVALNKFTGDEVWRTPGIAKCWSSPMLVDVGGKQELVLNVPKKLTGFDPRTGRELWHCEGIPDSYVCPSVISHDGVVFAIGGRKNTAIAVRAGGRGDVTDSHVLWRVSKGSNVSSPVYVDGHIYWLHESRGTAYCLNAKTGDVVYEERLEPRPNLLYASVTAADGKLYAPSRENGTYVLKASPQFKQLAVNVLEDDQSRTNASIVVHNNQLLLRSDKAIYCIAK
jgi:outer membrane protein assembly factor BamB